MGRSVTINIIGVSKKFVDTDGNERQRLLDCMNKTEMVQNMEKLRREGHQIESWYAQTMTGAKSLGSIFPFQEVPHENIKGKLPKLIVCPICKGKGKKHLGQNIYWCCPVCNGSGLTKIGCW